jgi:hypothetical protein
MLSCSDMSVRFWVGLVPALFACGGESRGARSSSNGGYSGDETHGGGGGAIGGSSGTIAGNSNAGGSSGTEPDSPAPCYGGCKDPDAPRPPPLPRPICPESEPEVDAACDRSGLRCSYGTAKTPQCRDQYECRAGSWQPVESVWPCSTHPAGYCPKAPQHEAACTIEIEGIGIPCDYGAVRCSCVSRVIQQDSPGMWVCIGPPENPACPAELPNLGEGCQENGLECNYAWDGCTAAPGSTVFCFDGAWEEGTPLVCL